MKKIFAVCCVAAMLFFGGCGKKEKKQEVKTAEVTTSRAFSKMLGADMLVAEKQAERDIPMYEADDIFDDGEVAEFAFIDDEPTEEVAKEEVIVAQSKVDVCDDWDDSELPLAWEEEKEDEYRFETVNFDLNRNAIRADQKVKVAQNVKEAAEAAKAGKKLVVAGHCCPLGSASYNMSLSEKRAKTIRDEMVKKGVPEENVRILGCGSECPVVMSDTPDRTKKIKELAPNRRAEISIS